jgi:branched-chain amino acid transport system ATP-binding protein
LAADPVAAADVGHPEIHGGDGGPIVLETRDLSAGYGDAAIVHDFSFRLAAGTITTLIGGNGAGKSTLMRAIFGTCRWMGGTILHRGAQIQRMPPWDRLARGIGLVPQGRCNFATMSVAENLKMACATLPRKRHAAAIERVVALFPVLADKLAVPAGNLSGGQQQLLETAMVLVPEPQLLLLDEPSLGLSPKAQEEVFAFVQRIAATGVTVLAVEQNVHVALAVSDIAVVMEQGRKFMEGPAREVLRDPRIRHAYLGGSMEGARR